MAAQARFIMVMCFVLFLPLPSAADDIGLDPNAATDFQQAQYRANQRIARYEAALARGNAAEIRRAALELQKDPLAVRQVNNIKGDSFKVRLNQEINAIQSQTKANIRRQLAQRYNVPESQVTFFEATNPSAKIKVGQDWDVTAQVKGKDVPLNVAQEVAHRSFYEAATGKKAPTVEAARHFSESQSVEVTNRAHAEAYGGGGQQLVYNQATGRYEVMTEGGAIIVGDKSTPLRDPQQLTQVMEHKSHLGKNMAAEVRAAGETYIAKNNLTGQAAEQVRSMANADAQAWELEQARQYTKQYGRQVEPRVAARGGNVHGQVVKGTKILDQVAKGEISPAEGRARLQAMGETPESIIQKGSSQIEAAQKLGDSPQDILNRAKTGKSPQDVFVQNVKDSIDLKRTEARAGQPKSLLDGGKSSFQGDSAPGHQPGSTLEQVRARAEAALQSEKLRTGQSINRPKSLLDGGKSSVGTAETPVVKGSELAEAANKNKGLVRSGSQKPASLPGRQAAGAAAEAAAAEAASTGGAVKTKIRGPSAQSTNPGGQLQAMGVPDRRPTLTPEQAGVKMPGRAEALSPEALNKTKWVKDPELARLSNPPGQDLAKAPEGHQGLADHAKGKGQAIDSGKMKTGAQQVAEPGKLATPELQEMARTGKRPASLLDGGKASSSHMPPPPSRAAQLDQAVGGRIMETVGLGEIPESASQTRKNFTKHGDRAMAAAAVAATAHEGYSAGHLYGEGLEAKGKAEDYRARALKAREAGNFAVADKLDKRAEEYEAEASRKMSQGLQDEALLVGTLGAAATVTGGAALAGYGAYKTGEASYGAAKGLSERMIQEEFGREVAAAQREGRAPSEAAASANAKARIAGELTGMRAGMEALMTDRDAERAAAETERRLKDRQHTAKLDLDDGLHEIALIEQRMRTLNKNPNQDDPWVKQRRQELLDQYETKRKDLQRMNDALGRAAGADDGEFIAIRSAVALLPQEPDYRRDEGERVEEMADAILAPMPDADDLADAMVTHQPTPEEIAGRKMAAASRPDSATVALIEGFSGTDPAGKTERERTRQAGERVTKKPEEVRKKDLEKERSKKEELERKEEEKKKADRRIDEERFTSDWSSTIRGINESLSDLNEQDAQKVKDMTEAAITLITQMQNGTLSDEDFTRQMAALENEHGNLQREGLEGWQRIRDRLVGDQVHPGGDGRADIQIGDDEADPCVNNFTMTNNSELRCKCQGYTFDNAKARCVKTGGGPGTASAGGAGSTAGTGAAGGATGTGNICPCVDEEGRRYRTPFGQPCSFDLGFIDRDYNCSDDTGGGGSSASRTGGSGGSAAGRRGMLYRIHTPPYGGGDVCLTAEEAAGIRNDPNTVLFEPLGEPCMK